MPQTSPASQSIEASPQAAPSQKDGEQPQPQNTPIPSPANVDDNPRSPKRRRISIDESRQDANAKPELPDSGRLSVPAKNPPSSDSQSQNVLTKPPSDGNVHEVAKPSPEGQIPNVPKGPLPAPVQNATRLPPQRPSPTRNNTLEHLPVLDQQASSILSFLSRLTPADAMGLSNRPNAPSSREYASLRAAFDRTRRLLSPGWPFLPQHDLGLRDSAQVEVIRKANQAIFMSSIFTGEIGLRDMDRSFLAVFVPENGTLLKAQGSMYLELKTQGFITAWRTGAAPPDLVMRDMFGPDLDKALLARRPGTTTLDPIEHDFLRSLASRRGILESAAKTKTLEQLPVRYKWEDFSREVSSYLITHIEKSSSNGAGMAKDDRNSSPGDVAGQLLTNALPLPVSSASSVPSKPPVQEDFVALAARAAEIALRSTLGLSVSDRIPELPSSKTATPAPNPVVQQHTLTPQPAEPESKPSELSKETAPTKSSDPPALVEESVGEDISHASRTAPTGEKAEADELDGETLLESERHDVVSTTKATPLTGIGTIESAVLQATTKTFQPSEADVEAVIARAVTTSSEPRSS